MKPFLLMLIPLLATACASSHVKTSHGNSRAVRRVALTAIQFTRPDYDPAEQDDFSAQDRVMDCTPPEKLWQDLLGPQKQAILGCLNSLDEVQGQYIYVPKTKPFLQLNPEINDQPDCLMKTLKTIPLPREIYFLGREANGEGVVETGTELSCFATSFNIKSNRVLDSELRYARTNINLQFPLSRKLKNEKDLEIWLLTTLLSVFNQDPADFLIRASVVPELTCKQCFKNDALFIDKKKHKLDPVEWP